MPDFEFHIQYHAEKFPRFVSANYLAKLTTPQIFEKAVIMLVKIALQFSHLHLGKNSFSRSNARTYELMMQVG